jgi:hypothetical protein
LNRNQVRHDRYAGRPGYCTPACRP